MRTSLTSLLCVHSVDQVAREEGANFGLQPVVLDLAAVGFLDATGLDVLSELLFKPSHGLHCVLADPAAPVLDTLARAGLLPKLGASPPHTPCPLRQVAPASVAVCSLGISSANNIPIATCVASSHVLPCCMPLLWRCAVQALRCSPLNFDTATQQHAAGAW